MQTSDNYLEALEAQFKQLTQAASDAAESDTDTSFLFNKFIHTQMALLLNGPDNMEELNQEIKRAHEIVLQNTAGHKVDPKLNAKVQQSKAKHTALFDFVRKHQDAYDVDPQQNKLQISKGQNRITKPGFSPGFVLNNVLQLFCIVFLNTFPQ